MKHYDVAIVGLGAMGSMTAWRAARQGLSVIGFDRFRPPHALGSSAGLSRIIRECYFEQRYYVPIVQRAYQIWAELERESGTSFLLQTGGLMIGPRDGTIATGAIASAEQFGLEAEVLDAAEVMRRYPPFRLTPEQIALYEPRAGVLTPEAAIAAALAQALDHGAELRFDEPVLEWTAGDRIVVRSAGVECTADRLVLAAGAWMAKDVSRMALPLRVARQVLFWLEPRGGREQFLPDRFPIFIDEWTGGRSIYGFPEQGAGLKIAIHHEGPTTDPDVIERTVAPNEEAELLDILARVMPDAVGPVIKTAVCMYTNTADQDFTLDFHPTDPRVVVASPCSGHGFKFSAAIGEIIVELITEGRSRLDITAFRIDRPALRPGATA